MDAKLRKWERKLQTDEGLQDRLHRLNPEGYPATKRGDLLSLKRKSEKLPIVVGWDGRDIRIEQRKARNPFFHWSIADDIFKKLFLTGKNPPVLVAMNNDQKNIKAGCDHHNGALALSFMVMLQECLEGGGK